MVQAVLTAYPSQTASAALRDSAVLQWTTYPSMKSLALCSAAMALSSGRPTRSRKQRAGSARMVLYFSYPAVGGQQPGHSFHLSALSSYAVPTGS